MKILYIYDVEDWAIHNVGRYWSGLLGSKYVFTFCHISKLREFSFADYDWIFWGYSKLRFSALMSQGGARHELYRILFDKLDLYGKTAFGAGRKFITVVHDPCELYLMKPSWKDETGDTRHLFAFSRIAVASSEMQHLLMELGHLTAKINTESLLPVRDSNEIATEDLAVFSKVADSPRKNIPLMREIQSVTAPACSKFDIRVGHQIIDNTAYIRLIDSYNCYICTSWQEGGPLPLRDAQKRGCVVLTTRVGQTDEWVEDGVNGFFCDTRDQFVEKVRLLSSDRITLREMRLNTLAAVAASRDAMIRQQLVQFLE